MPRPPSPLRPTELWSWTQNQAEERDRTELLARWMARYAAPDALERWYAAPPSQGGPHAFAALVQQPGLLRRLSPTWASLLVRDAEDHAQGLAGLSDKAGRPTPIAAAVAEVHGAIKAWRLARPGPPAPLRAGAMPHPLLRRARGPAGGRLPGGSQPAGSGAETDRPEVPAPREGAPGQALAEAMAAVARIGASGLGRMGFQDAQVLAAAVTRHIGGQLRAGTLPASAWGTARDALLSLQAHSAETGAYLFLAERYAAQGERSAAHGAAELSADLAVCGAAAKLGRGTPPEWRNWSVAEEAHAFAALMLDRQAPETLAAPERARLLRAWRRAAAALEGLGEAPAGSEDPAETARRLVAWHMGTDRPAAGRAGSVPATGRKGGRQPGPFPP